ncbi:hypothetical protein V6Z12_D06G097200 [Gossypium hirsutum]
MVSYNTRETKQNPERKRHRAIHTVINRGEILFIYYKMENLPSSESPKAKFKHKRETNKTNSKRNDNAIIQPLFARRNLFLFVSNKPPQYTIISNSRKKNKKFL